MDSATETRQYGPVSEFYRGKSIFMTGGTGFVGKVLIEKLLWSCPGIEKIYMLMRPKRSKDVTTRFAEILNGKVFERLRKSRPSELEKIVPVIGDLAEPGLGLSPSDKDVLLQAVSVVFHVGASVRLIVGRPNVYTYSKALAENILQKESGALPIAIVRPSIVVSSAKEPMAGWTDSWGGPSPLFAAAYAGLVRLIFAKPHVVADLVPVDMVANLTISSAWHTATKSGQSQLDVYNLCSGFQNPITWREFVDICGPIARANPLERSIVPPCVSLQSNWNVYHLQTLFLEKLPLKAVDFVFKIIGKTSNFAGLHSKLMEGVRSLGYFTTREWKFKDDNVRSLYCSLEKTDQETFPFLTKSIDWNKYFHSFVLGIRHYLLKNDPSYLKRVKKPRNWLPWVKKLLVLFPIMCIVLSVSRQCS